MPLTIDERLDRLTERHEALTQSVELMVVENRERDRQANAKFIDIMEAITRLVHVAEIHEQRIEEERG